MDFTKLLPMKEDHLSQRYKFWVFDHPVITWEEYQEYREEGMNSWEQEDAYGRMDNECLLKHLETVILPNCGSVRRGSGRPATTYDEAVVIVFAPLLMERIRLLEKTINTMEDEIIENRIWSE